MVRLTFWGGVGEIGGNKILLEDGETRIWLDFGLSFRQKDMYYSEFMQPRNEQDLLFTGLLPDVPGLYRFDEEHGQAFDAILLTHAHMDHYLYASFAKPDIPLYASYGTAEMLRALHAPSPRGCSRRDLESSFYFGPSGEVFRQISHRRPFRIGSLRITPYRVNHSIIDNMNFIIDTSAGPIVYATDFRSGPFTQKFIEACAAAKPRLMLCDGTNVGQAEPALCDEHEVMREVEKVLIHGKYPVIINFSFKNLDRFYLLLRLIRERGKQLVVTTKVAHVLSALLPDLVTEYREQLRIYRARKGRRDPWEERVLARFADAIVTEKMIREGGENFVILFEYWQIKEFAGIRPRGSSYIFSRTLPFTPRQEMQMTVLENWAKLLGMQIVHAHTSGHMAEHELMETIRQINPHMLIPIHTERPALMRRRLRPTVRDVPLPHTGQSVEL
jgi:ribonuclease J